MSHARALPTLRIDLPLAAFAELPLALAGACASAALGWLLAAACDQPPLAPALVGVVIGVCASQLHRERRPRRAVITLLIASLGIALFGVALERGAPLFAWGFAVIGLSLAAGGGARERGALVRARLGLSLLVHGLLCASLGRAVLAAPTLLVCVAAAAPVFVASWLLTRVELRLEAPPLRRAVGPYR